MSRTSRPAAASQRTYDRTPQTVLQQLKQLAAKWNAGFRGSSGTKGTSVWKQILKNHFVQLTQFDSQRSGQEKGDLKKGKWKWDLKTAATRTINEICPLWQNNSTHRAIYNLILQEADKEMSPRKRWLEEKAYAWLKNLPTWSDNSKIQIEQESLHPGHAISVAYYIFLGSPYNFATFVKYLRTRHNETIEKLISAHDAQAAHHYQTLRQHQPIAREVFD